MNPYPLTLLYDGACPVCAVEVEHLAARDTQHRLRFIDISVAGFDPQPYGVPLADMLAAMHAVRRDGTVVRGVEVFRLAYAAVGLGWITRPTGWPLLKPFFDRAYAVFARNRYRIPRSVADFLFSMAAKRAVKRTQACRNDRCEID